MAELRLQAGPITATRTANNATAQTILLNFLRRQGYDPATMTAQVQADTVLDVLVQIVRERAQEYKLQQAIAATQAATVPDEWV